MQEFSFIDSIKQSTYRQSSLVKGVGDDAAVFRPVYQDVVTAVDTMVEGVHFSKATMRPYHVGYRALAVNISDLAAMGSEPVFYMVSIVAPDDWTEAELAEIYSGLHDIAASYRMDLIGGDTVSGSELVVSVTVMGYVPKDKARYRSTAQPGDIVFVTGTLGDAQAGFELLSGRKQVEDKEASAYFIKRHRQPSPRPEFALALQSLSRLTLNDISDGLASEANEIVESSQVALHIDYDKLPHHHWLASYFPDETAEWSLTGGEDFELVGCVRGQDWPHVLQAGEESGLSVTAIGHVEAAASDGPRAYLHEQGKQKVLAKSGYTHLK
ncbi:thiamine-phosphate kinase [Thalassobacillus sp. CUG 92003]|uniref:thiamine-phosphate kinase n=1 Tax=Thalassobacillus sp. CUG 92003 TaxID=2736641 RepID=UPI0015E642E1|nr:thiamine-phosphate kinase [Thalassobacillus sp. CUG 92003]